MPPALPHCSEPAAPRLRPAPRPRARSSRAHRSRTIRKHRSAKFPAVKNLKVISDGETLRLGSLAITARFTPGHTPGATTWTWRSCEGSRCLNVVYADSLSAVSDDGFRFSGGGAGASLVETFRKSLAVVEALPCDVLLVPHPFVMGMEEKLARQRKEPSVNPFVDAGAAGRSPRLSERRSKPAWPARRPGRGRSRKPVGPPQ